MNDGNQPDHWDALVSELGATPPPREEKKPDLEPGREKSEAEAAAGRPRAGQIRSAERPPSKRRADPTDWSRLAAELGLEIPKEALAPPMPVGDSAPLSGPAEAWPDAGGTSADVRAAPLAPPDDVVPDSAGADIDWPGVAGPAVAPEAGSVGAAAGPTDLGIRPAAGLGPPDTELEPAPIRRGAAGSAPERDEKKTGRKRRRRRRKPARPGPDQPAEIDQRSASQVDAVASTSLEGDLSPPSGAAETRREDARGRSEDRRRRSAPRRGGAAVEEDSESAEAEGDQDLELLEDESAGAEDASGAAADVEPEDGVGPVGAPRQEKSGAAAKWVKPGHRGIPTWEEAVGVVVSANMEARTKNRNGGASSRSRGGRRPAGRGRSSEKPT